MKTIKKLLLLTIVLSFTVSCSEDDTENLFSQAPAERIEARNNMLLEALTAAPNGFKALYFSKNNEFGGFTFYMRFNADGTVDMTSDVDAETAIATSTYDVRFGTTNELVFTTRNHIQKLSDAFAFPDTRTGFKGNSVFQFFSNENDSITFRDVRNRNTASLVLTPSNLSNFEEESVSRVERTLVSQTNLAPTETRSVFQILRIENASGVTNFNLNYNAERLFANPLLELDNGEVIEYNFGVLFTENGINISPAIEFEGEIYENFIFNANSGQYVSTVNGTTASIFFGNEPASINRLDVEEVVNLGPNGFLYRPSLGENQLTSLGFDALLEGVSLNFEDAGLGAWNVTDVQLIIDYESNNCGTTLLIEVTREEDDSSFFGIFCFERGAIAERKLFLNYIEPIQGQDVLTENSEFFEDLVMPIIDFFNSASGLAYTSEGSFASSLAQFSNSSGTFASLDNPALRVYGLWFL